MRLAVVLALAWLWPCLLVAVDVAQRRRERQLRSEGRATDALVRELVERGRAVLELERALAEQSPDWKLGLAGERWERPGAARRLA